MQCEEPFQTVKGFKYNEKKIIQAMCPTKNNFWLMPSVQLNHKENVDALCVDNCVFNWDFQLLESLKGSINFLFKTNGYAEQFGFTIRVGDVFNVIKG